MKNNQTILKTTRSVAVCLAFFVMLGGSFAVSAQNNAPNQTKKGGLLSPQNSTVLLVDHQPGVAFPIQSIDRAALVNNSTALTKTAVAFGVPLVLSTIREDSSGPLFAEILAAAPNVHVIKRPSRRNAWGDPNFVTAVEKTGRKKARDGGIVDGSLSRADGAVGDGRGLRSLFRDRRFRRHDARGARYGGAANDSSRRDSGDVAASSARVSRPESNAGNHRQSARD